VEIFVQKIGPLLLNSNIFTRLFLSHATLDFLICCEFRYAFRITNRALLVADVVNTSFVCWLKYRFEQIYTDIDHIQRVFHVYGRVKEI
jgi:hypothetical protein